MAQSLRELLLSIKIKVDKAAVKETDVAFDHATKSAQGFEDTTNKITAGLQKVATKLRLNTELAKKFRAAVIASTGLRPEAPSNRAARERRAADADALGMRSASHPAPPRPGQSLAAPDVAAFADTRTGPQKALDAFKAKANAAFASAGAAAERFNQRFDKVAGTIFNAQTAIAGFAAVMAGAAIGRFLGSIIEAGGALHDMAQRTRVSVETLQVWRSIAADAGADAGAVESAFRKLSRSMAAAARGSKLQAASFKDLGVEYRNADGSLRSAEDVLIDTGAALNNLDDDAKATAIATQLLGPAGAALVPAFKDGAEAVRRLSVELRENVSLNAEEAARLDDVGDALARGSKKWTAMKMRLGVALLPVLEAVANGFEKLSKWLLRMTKETKFLQTALLGLIGFGLARVTTALVSWIAKVGGARAALALLGQGLRTASGFALRFLAPLLLIEDFLVFLAGGKSLFGRAFEEIFGPGGAKNVREGILVAFQEIGKFVNETLLPAFRSLVDNDLFKGAAKGALDAVLVTLNAIGFALADTDEKAAKLAQRFKQLAPGFAPSDEERDAALKAGLPGNRKEMNWFEKAARKVTTGVLGDPLNDPAVRGNAEANAKRLEERRLMVDNIVAYPAAPPQPAASKSVTLNDQRKIEINVGSGTATPGATGRAVGGAVESALQIDQRQVLQSVGG